MYEITRLPRFGKTFYENQEVDRFDLLHVLTGDLSSASGSSALGRNLFAASLLQFFRHELFVLVGFFLRRES